MQADSLYHIYDGLCNWYDPVGTQTHDLPWEADTLTTQQTRHGSCFYIFFLRLGRLFVGVFSTGGTLQGSKHLYRLLSLLLRSPQNRGVSGRCFVVKFEPNHRWFKWLFKRWMITGRKASMYYRYCQYNFTVQQSVIKRGFRKGHPSEKSLTTITITYY